MSARLVLVLALALARSAIAAEPASSDPLFVPTKDVRLSFFVDEVHYNGGQSSHLRARSVTKNAGEVFIIDFDRKAVATWIEKQKGKPVVGKLMMTCTGVGSAAKAKLETAVLETTADWVEGGQQGSTAAKGEPSFLEAQTGVAPWTNAKGKKVEDLRALFYDKAFDKVLAPANSTPLEVDAADKDKLVTVELDPVFMRHFASPTCKGLIFFTREGDATIDFYSREQVGKEPKLALSVVGK